jgi:hypothetical protein
VILLLRWLLFLTIGLLGQVLVYFLYPWLVLIWAVLIYQPVDHKPIVHHDFNIPLILGNKTIAGGYLLDNADNHGAFSQYGFIQKEGLELLQVDGALIRKYQDQAPPDQSEVSGDVVIAWFFANTLADRKVSDEVLKKVVDHYLVNLGMTSKDTHYGDGYVSNRCANFGINYAPDSDFLAITQPAAGPQYYTTAAVLASAYHLGFKYKALFWAHYVVMGGWYWAWVPMIYPDYDTWWYVRDMTMKSLYVQLQVFGPRWWITRPMAFINDKTTLVQNDLFNAMMHRPVGPLPQVMDSFFSQKADGRSGLSDRMSAYIPQAIRKIQKESLYPTNSYLEGEKHLGCRDRESQGL